MLNCELSKKVDKWSADLKEDGQPEDRYQVAAQLIEFLHEHLYKNYDPCNSPGSLSFYHRLEKWLNSTDNEEFEKILFLSVLDINFVNEHEMQCLYRNGHAEVMRWLAKINQVNFLDKSAQNILTQAHAKNWSLPATDSFIISEFYHVNNISGFDHRPCWRDLYKLGSNEKIQTYININHIKYITILEDFVGSGSQLKKEIEKCNEFPSVEFLFCPMLICPTGDKLFKRLNTEITNLTYKPICLLQESCFVEHPRHELLSKVLKYTYKVHHDGIQIPKKNHTWKGFRDTGSLTIMHTNCPNNVPPAFHLKTSEWSPLFPRASRL